MKEAAEDGGLENVSGERSNPQKPTTIQESPPSAPQGQGPLGPSSRSLFGIQPVRPTTRRGKTKILAIVAPERINQESRNRIDGTRPMPLIVNGTQDGREVTEVQVNPLAPRVVARHASRSGNRPPIIKKKDHRTDLTPTGLLMESDYTQNRSIVKEMGVLRQAQGAGAEIRNTVAIDSRLGPSRE